MHTSAVTWTCGFFRGPFPLAVRIGTAAIAGAGTLAFGAAGVAFLVLDAPAWSAALLVVPGFALLEAAWLPFLVVCLERWLRASWAMARVRMPAVERPRAPGSRARILGVTIGLFAVNLGHLRAVVCAWILLFAAVAIRRAAASWIRDARNAGEAAARIAQVHWLGTFPMQRAEWALRAGEPDRAIEALAPYWDELAFTPGGARRAMSLVRQAHLDAGRLAQAAEVSALIGETARTP